MFLATSGNYYKPAFMCTYEVIGIDHILLGTDYPYEDTEECLKFLEDLPLLQDDKNKIYWNNAHRLGIVE